MIVLLLHCSEVLKLAKPAQCIHDSQMHTMYVYILQCNDASYYIGVTNDYGQRFAEHQQGIDPRCFTFKRRPLALVYIEAFDDPIDAIMREKQLKGWSRKKKEALIAGNDPLLWRLSENKTGNVTTRHRRHGELAEP